MKESYVSYEVAKRLKELGFICDCRGYYHYDDVSKVMVLSTPLNHNNKNLFKSICSAPRLDEAQKWLREVKEISVEPLSNLAGQWNVNVCEIGVAGEVLWSKIGCDSYESALSAGISAALTLLTEKQ